MRLLLTIILVFITVLACYIEDLFLHIWPAQTDQALYLTIRSNRNFNFDQQSALDVKRQDALARYIPVYRYTLQDVEVSIKKFKAFIQALNVKQAAKSKKIASIRHQLQTEFGVQLSQASVSRIIDYRDLNNLLQGILTIKESILQNKIVDNPKQLTDNKTIVIKGQNSEGTVVYPVNRLISLENARIMLDKKIRQLFWQVDKRVLNPIVQLSQATLGPTLEYDRKENARRLDNINRQFPSQMMSYKAGDVLVPFGKILTGKDVLLLNDYQKDNLVRLKREAVVMLFIILLIVGFYNLFLSKILINGYRGRPPYRFALVLLIITTILLLGYLVLTPFPIYGLPFCLLPMLIIFLNHSKIIATATTAAGAMLVSLFAGPTYEILLFFSLGGFLAVLVCSDLQQRRQIIFPSLLVGFINALMAIIFILDWQSVYSFVIDLQAAKLDNWVQHLDTEITWTIAWATLGGLAAGPMAILLLPLLEISWDTASDFKLTRYIDPNRLLMKELLSKAPGTYQHSMTVAHLAQTAGEAIGANTLLLRIGAYYHDIGKMMNPNLFIENQFKGENPHDVLEPRESARIIFKHVRHGVRIGQEAGLPKVVVNLIQQHHGTQLMEYFYDIAAKTYPKSTLQEAEFRYPGPKPQSVEAAVLMIADAVEAGSRSIEDPTRKKFEKLVRLILLKRIVDGQFSECDMTSRDLSKIVTALVDALQASFHSRIRYPWQQKKAPPRQAEWKIKTDTRSDQEDRAFRL